VLDRKVRVQIRDDRGNVGFVVFADEEGRFGVSGIPFGMYTVEVASPDFTATPQTVNVRDVQPTAFVLLTLEPTRPSNASPVARDPTVGVEQLRPVKHKAMSEYRHGISAGESGNYAAALKHYQAALRLQPDFYAAEVNYGALLFRTGKLAEARAHLLHAIQIDPAPPLSYLNLGRVYYEQRDYASAEKYLQLAMERAPSSEEIQLLYGATEDELGNLANAEKALSTARTLNPTDGQVLLQLFNLYRRENRDAEARKALQQFLRDHASDKRAPQIRAALAHLPG
jgi:tetratricopeptide (TPR) repeat protein